MNKMKPAGGGSKPPSRQASPAKTTPVDLNQNLNSVTEDADEDRGTFANGSKPAAKEEVKAAEKPALARSQTSQPTTQFGKKQGKEPEKARGTNVS